MKNVLVFKTSVSTSFNVNEVKPLLDDLMNYSENWNFDLEDCDRILRVEAYQLKPNDIIQNLNKAGFVCEELAD